jgi:decaprenylphospho-beta-D-erythro-pentofuranosid-2-ulose 2-reductase
MSKEPRAERPGAIVIGASGGIGAALARELTGRGYSVALVGRRHDALEPLCREINAARSADEQSVPAARAYQHNVTDGETASALFDAIRRDLGAGGSELRAVVYAAGVMPGGTRGAWSFDDERAAIETNLTGAIRWLDLAAEAFRRIGRGTVVGISSVAGDRGRKGNSAYMASKAGLSVYLESLRYRLHGTGVRVVTVKPGYVATPMTAGMKLPKPLVVAPEVVAQRIARLCEGGPTVAYVPGYWRIIMAVVRAVPAALMPRLPI